MLRGIYRLSRFAARQESYSPQTEQVLIVNEMNERIGACSRLQMRTERLCHRSTFIYILGPEGKLFVQKRTVSKDIFPGFYDLATGGVVSEDDPSDLESAKRELLEEMGIEGVELEFCFNYFYKPGPVWGAVFLTYWDRELVLQPEEIQWVELMSTEEIFLRSQTEEFTPDSLEILRILCSQGKIR